MRRKEKEISSTEEKLKIIAESKVCRLGFSDNDFPYVIPLNYGYSFENGILTLFFHGSKDGRKMNIIKKNNKACFEIDIGGRLIVGKKACNFSYAFKSLIGFGKIVVLEKEEEKIDGLNKIMKHQTGRTFLYEDAALEKTAVYKLISDEWTGKQKELPENKKSLEFKEIKTEQEINILSALIAEIWTEVFIPIIGKEQVDYMLVHYQGKDKIKSEIKNGIRYFLIEYADEASGYFAYSLENDHLFIRKIYLKKALRGRGLSSIIFNYFEKTAHENNKDKLFLHVNRRNKRAVETYIHRGFEVVKIVDEPLGEKFFLNDYWMQKNI